MAWYFVFLNFLLVSMVVGRVVGSHVWPIATWPGPRSETAEAEATREPAVTAGLVPRPAV